MDIQILNIAELLLFVFMICTCIRIYRQKKQKGKISLKTLIMFLMPTETGFTSSIRKIR